MSELHELVGQSVIVVWALQYQEEGAKPETYRVLALDAGLLKLCEEKTDGDDGNIFWVPLSSISNITQG